MKRTMIARGLACALLAAATVALGAQEAARSNPYQGTSNPPPDDTIVTPAPENTRIAKPSPSHRAYSAPAARPQSYAAPEVQHAPPPDAAETVPVESLGAPVGGDGTDADTVRVAPAVSASEPGLSQRPAFSDPDGDIVHLAPPPPGELSQGVTIRAWLLDRLSSSASQPGDAFHARVASDVVQDGQVLIPAGSEIGGRVISASAGHFGGAGSMRVRPETVTLPDGSRFRLYAQLSGAPGSNDRIGNESLVTPGSRMKRVGIEYAGTIGVSAVTGAILGGPVGALAGTVVGASVISVHLLVSHPQATLDEGAVVLFTLSEPLNLAPAGPSGN